MNCPTCEAHLRQLLVFKKGTEKSGQVLSEMEMKLYLRELDYDRRLRRCIMCGQRCLDVQIRPVLSDGLVLCVACTGDQPRDTCVLYRPILLHCVVNAMACPRHGSSDTYEK